jgi:hypothetical protein
VWSLVFKEMAMRKSLHSLVVAVLTAVSAPTLITPGLAADSAAAPAAPAAPAASAAHYSVNTTLVGQMLDDPAATALLKKMIPNAYANEMFQSVGRDMTLKAIQEYEPELTDENLAKIQAELNKIPAKK